MAEIGKWSGFVFEVSPNVIRGFTGMTIKGGSETENKVSSKQQYVKRKNSTATEVNVKIHLNAFLGCSVRSEADELIHAASDGKTDYFYVGGKKLVTCKLMLVGAEVSEIVISPEGEWISCDVSLNMKQCAKWDGNSSTSGSGGSNSSGNKKSSASTAKKQTVKTESVLTKVVNTVKNTVSNVVEAAKTAVKTVTSKLSASTSSKSSSTSKATNTIKKAVTAVKNVVSTAKKASTTTTKSSSTKSSSTSVAKTVKKAVTNVANKIKALVK